MIVQFSEVQWQIAFDPTIPLGSYKTIKVALRLHVSLNRHSPSLSQPNLLRQLGAFACASCLYFRFWDRHIVKLNNPFDESEVPFHATLPVSSRQCQS